MKAQTKALVASVVVIALALSAVSGITYSWFSDTEQSEVTITTGKIDLDAKYSNVQVKSYGDDSAKKVELNNEGGTTTTLNGNVKATTSNTTTNGAAGSQLAITFSGAAPGDEITFKMAVTLVNTIYVTYKQSIIMDNEAPFEVTGFENKTLQGTAVNNGTGLNASSYYMLGSENAGAEVTIKFKQNADVESYGDKQYTMILAVQAIQMNVQPAEIAATKTIGLGTASADTVLTVKSAENTADITITLPTTTEATDSTASSVSVTAKALTAAEVKANSTMYVATSTGSVLAGVEVSKSVEIKPGIDGETQQYFKIEMNVGTLSAAVESALKVYHAETEVKKQGSQSTGAEYYTYADGVVTIYALSFSPFVVIDGSEAVIGTEKYASLSEAITAVNGGTAAGNEITLLKDVSYSDDLTVSKDATLNLNGHVISFTGSAGFVYSAALTVIGSEDGSKITAETGSMFYSNTTGSVLTINGGMYEAQKNVIYSSAPMKDVGGGGWEPSGDGGSVKITAGTFRTTTSNKAFTVMVYYGNLDISGGEFFASYESCIYASDSTVNISGGDFSVSSYVIDMASNVDLTISGGNFTGKTGSYDVSLIQVGSGDTAKITGGDFKVILGSDDKAGKSARFFYIGTGATASVTGGTFTYQKEEGSGSTFVMLTKDGESNQHIFAGGTVIGLNPKDYVAEDYEATTSDDQTYTITKKATSS